MGTTIAKTTIIIITDEIIFFVFLLNLMLLSIFQSTAYALF